MSDLADLADLIVLDCSGTLGGGYCAKLLGDAGASVTILEPAEGSPVRRWAWGHPVPNGEDGALFRYLHHGHRSVTDATAKATLLEHADITITSNATKDHPGPHELALQRPDAIVVSITPYGLTGPYADRPATEFTAQAESGAIAIRGDASRPPIQMGGRVIEWVAGAYGAIAALAARRRQATFGRGDLIDISLCEVANLAGTLFVDLSHSLAGSPELPTDKPIRSLELPSIEPTLDGWVGFNTNTRVQFDSFCLLIERPDLIDEGVWAPIATRSARAAEWNAIVRSWTSQRTTAEIVELAAALRVPAAPVCDGAAVIGLEQVRACNILVDDPTRSFVQPRRPWSIDDMTPPDLGPAPTVGRDDDAPLPTPASREPRPDDGTRPLAGLRVVDLTAWWAGPSATGLLADLGAEVVHVESISSLDGMRMAGGMFFQRDQWWEYSSFFLQANANKLGLTLDLATARGRELLLTLIGTADLVVENFTPRVLEQFDLDWDVIHAANPRAVMVRMPAFGLRGPWRDRPGFAQTMEQVTGLAWVTGHVDDQPRIQRGPCDPNGGLHAAFAALVGLERRDRTGEGCLVVAPMLEAALNVAAEVVLECSAYGNAVRRDGNRGPEAAPQGLYPCAGWEQWLALAVTDDTQWAALAGILGSPTLAGLDLGTVAQRRLHHDEIDAAIAAWVAPRHLHDTVDTLVAAGIPAAAVRDPRLAHQHPQFMARGYFESVVHPVVGTHFVPGVPWRATGVPHWLRDPAPTLGEHNRQVLGGWLGCDDQELADLESAGVIGTWPKGL